MFYYYYFMRDNRQILGMHSELNIENFITNTDTMQLIKQF